MKNEPILLPEEAQISRKSLGSAWLLRSRGKYPLPGIRTRNFGKSESAALEIDQIGELAGA